MQQNKKKYKFNSRDGKVSSTARHRCNVSSELCSVLPRRQAAETWASPRVTPFGVIAY